MTGPTDVNEIVCMGIKLQDQAYVLWLNTSWCHRDKLVCGHILKGI